MTKFLALLVALTSPAMAQVSLEEMDAAMQSRDAELAAFQERLNDPDPERALAALNLLITKGDVDQRRLAIRHGLYSTDTAIRATTLRAIFDSSPTLVMKMSPVPDEPSVYYFRNVAQANGTLSEDNASEVLRKVNGYDEKEHCWTIAVGVRSTCYIRMRGEVVSLFFGDRWGQYSLNATGQLEGEQMVYDTLTKAVVDLSE